VKKDGNIVKVLRPDQIQNYVQRRQMSPDLRDYVYNSLPNSMSNLPTLTVDFTDADRHIPKKRGSYYLRISLNTSKAVEKFFW
jgi:hypothetical protein